MSILFTSAASASPNDLEALYGKSVKLAGSPKEQVKLQVDLDGDKTKDEIYLVELKGKPSSQVRIIKFETSANPSKGMALAVVRHPAKGTAIPYLFLFSDSYFDSPTWKKGCYSKMVGLGHGPQPPKDAKGQSIRMFTESGAWYYLYWNGKTFVDSNEGDEP